MDYFPVRKVTNKIKILCVMVLMFIAMCGNGCGKDQGYTHLSHYEAQKMMRATDALVVDVRTKEEYDKRHITGAVLVPIDDIRAGKLSAISDKNQVLLIYCWTGRRAEDAAVILAKLGYKNVYEFGGLVDWQGEETGQN